ncbi:hypothetical protein MATL_G00004440 [Megalops atlanticus]|uniref:CSD domain-containing protein n=1 Tax=Megalops atlanticus TaxID=7932 RepID=A0A9D3QFX1_MEGAT|nr:hypothetical protein MATL_G00004440 [Megalops atlanticus]
MGDSRCKLIMGTQMNTSASQRWYSSNYVNVVRKHLHLCTSSDRQQALYFYGSLAALRGQADNQSTIQPGSRVWERKPPQPGELPSPLPTKRTRTYSATVRATSGPVFKGVCKTFSRSQGHGFIRPSNGGEDIFVHISDIEGEYVPMEGDEVTYKVCPIPPKNLKIQAVEVVITHLNPGTKHETWSGQIISS